MKVEIVEFDQWPDNEVLSKHLGKVVKIDDNYWWCSGSEEAPYLLEIPKFIIELVNEVEELKSKVESIDSAGASVLEKRIQELENQVRGLSPNHNDVELSVIDKILEAKSAEYMELFNLFRDVLDTIKVQSRQIAEFRELISVLKS